MPIFSEELNSRRFAVIYQNYKLMIKPRSTKLGDQNQYYDELYNLVDDKGENINVLERKDSSKYFSTYNELNELLNVHISRLFGEGSSERKISIGEKAGIEKGDLEERRRLRELGYL